MKKIITIFLVCVSCNSRNYDAVYYTKNVKKCIKNLELMEKWIANDLESGLLSKEMADDYMLNVTHTKLSLMKKYRKYD